MPHFAFPCHPPDALLSDGAAFALAPGFDAGRHLLRVEVAGRPPTDAGAFRRDIPEDGSPPARVLAAGGRVVAAGPVRTGAACRLWAPDGEASEIVAIEVGGAGIGLAASVPLLPGRRYLAFPGGAEPEGRALVAGPGRSLPGFAPGTLILTDRGYRPVEGLVPGDRVETLDGGAAPVLHVGAAEVPLVAALRCPALRPVTLAAPVPGAGAPFRPLTLSAAQGVLLRHPWLALAGPSAEATCPAGWLPAAPPRLTAGWFRWHHLLLAEPAPVRANGLWVESLHAPPAVLARLPSGLRAGIAAALGGAVHGDRARPALRRWEAEAFLACAAEGAGGRRRKRVA